MLALGQLTEKERDSTSHLIFLVLLVLSGLLWNSEVLTSEAVELAVVCIFNETNVYATTIHSLRCFLRVLSLMMKVSQVPIRSMMQMPRRHFYNQCMKTAENVILNRNKLSLQKGELSGVDPRDRVDDPFYSVSDFCSSLLFVSEMTLHIR